MEKKLTREYVDDFKKLVDERVEDIKRWKEQGEKIKGCNWCNVIGEFTGVNPKGWNEKVCVLCPAYDRENETFCGGASILAETRHTREYTTHLKNFKEITGNWLKWAYAEVEKGEEWITSQTNSNFLKIEFGKQKIQYKCLLCGEVFILDGYTCVFSLELYNHKCKKETKMEYKHIVAETCTRNVFGDITYYARIVEQSHRGEKFGINGWKFKSLTSDGSPEVTGGAYCVRGSYKKKDSDIMEFGDNEERFEEFKSHLRAYNKHFSGATEEKSCCKDNDGVERIE